MEGHKHVCQNSKLRDTQVASVFIIPATSDMQRSEGHPHVRTFTYQILSHFYLDIPCGLGSKCYFTTLFGEHNLDRVKIPGPTF